MDRVEKVKQSYEEPEKEKQEGQLNAQFSGPPVEKNEGACPAPTTAAQQLKVFRCRADAYLPTMVFDSTGYDLRAATSGVAQPYVVTKIGTGLEVGIPEGYHGRIASRSSLGINHYIQFNAEPINPDHKGEVVVSLYNAGPEAYHFEKGDTIAQLILERACSITVVEVERNQLSSTANALNGIRSSEALPAMTSHQPSKDARSCEATARSSSDPRIDSIIKEETHDHTGLGQYFGGGGYK